MQPIKDFATLPMAIPAIESVVSGGTGALMAGAAGGMIGGAAVWGIGEHLKTAIMQEQARQSQAYARAVEAAYMNQRNGTEMGRNTDR
jgi:membrane protein YqaA with SNARE-associated domain